MFGRYNISILLDRIVGLVTLLIPGCGCRMWAVGGAGTRFHFHVSNLKQSWYIGLNVILFATISTIRQLEDNVGALVIVVRFHSF